MQVVQIDGSYGEGGGQVLRTSLTLSVLLGVEVEITRIRAGRSKPGLAAQHVTCVQAAAAICGARVRGAEVGSRVVRLTPGAVRGGEYVFDVADVRPSAGSVSLVLQTVLPALLYAAEPSRLTLRGGTNVPWSPPYEYIRDVFLPAVAGSGVRATIRRLRGGWYPAGGGELAVEIAPLEGPLRPFSMPKPGPLRRLVVTSTVTSGLPEHILKRQTAAALQALPTELSRRARRTQEQPEGGPGTCLSLAVEYERGYAGASALGERGKPAEAVGKEAAGALTDYLASAAAVDRHLADQLLLYAALAEGESLISGECSTRHLTTNAWVIHQFLGQRVTIEGESPVMIHVEGASLPAPGETPE